ncbi:MAG: NHLP leader peptide family RiPP precursor [Bacteroidia bacterium]|nr:NHLP leader peptide family RiPP precursor [Bacteroidia bacterium]
MKLSKNQKIISQLLERVWEDDDFKERLIANPEEVIIETTGDMFDLPDGKELEIVDQTDPDKVYFNLSPKPDMDEIELTDEQLELIAGGASDSDVAAASQNLP